VGKFAAGTEVSSERTRAELERLLKRYGATRYGCMNEPNRALVVFEANGRMVQFELPMPPRDAAEFVKTPRQGKRRSPAAAEAAWEQATRQRWRALLLVVKAKLEAVESGISTFELEFLAHLVLPDGRTFGTWALPQITAAYQTGRMPQLLLEAGPGTTGPEQCRGCRNAPPRFDEPPCLDCGDAQHFAPKGEEAPGA
jgi:hypothetical protein